MQLAVGLMLAFASAVAVNIAYASEHDAAASMPAFSPQHPRQFVLLLIRSRRWVAAFGTETGGWIVYVLALRLAPLSLVQAVCASGVAVLAIASTNGHPSLLAPRERVAVVVAVGGLALLALSLVDSHQSDRAPTWQAALLWLAATCAAAAGLAVLRAGLPRGPALGMAAGLLFAGGDISAKLVVYGGSWFIGLVPLIVCYAFGTSVLQRSFQFGDAVTGAGLATLTTNALPIAAGFIVFDEQLPTGIKAPLQLAAFSCLVVGAVLLARTPSTERLPDRSVPAQRAARAGEGRAA